MKKVTTLSVFDRKIDVKISEALIEATIEGRAALHNYYATHGNPKVVPRGDAWAETSEITHPVVQHMIRSKIAETQDTHAHMIFLNGPVHGIGTRTRLPTQLRAGYLASA